MKLYSIILLPVARWIGRKGGSKVKSDLDSYNQHLESLWTLEDKVTELALDKELSYSYLKGLIVECATVDSLEKVKKYLIDNAKTVNLTSSQRSNLMKQTKEKILDIQIALYQEKRRKEFRRKFSKQQTKLG